MIQKLPRPPTRPLDSLHGIAKVWQILSFGVNDGKKTGQNAAVIETPRLSQSLSTNYIL